VQSFGQVPQSSLPGVQTPSPHDGPLPPSTLTPASSVGGGGQPPQSVGHVPQFSVPWHFPSPHEILMGLPCPLPKPQPQSHHSPSSSLTIQLPPESTHIVSSAASGLQASAGSWQSPLMGS
jgi:hypothetical protein